MLPVGKQSVDMKHLALMKMLTNLTNLPHVTIYEKNSILV